MKNGEVTDDTRIKAALPTINYLSEQGAIVILASHLGRPKGEVVEGLRLDPVAKRLSDLIGKEIVKTDAVYGKEVNEAISQVSDGDIVLIENVRFEPGEEKTTQVCLKHLLIWLMYMLMMRLELPTVLMHLQQVLRRNCLQQQAI